MEKKNEIGSPGQPSCPRSTNPRRLIARRLYRSTKAFLKLRDLLTEPLLEHRVYIEARDVVVSACTKNSKGARETHRPT